MGPGVGVFLMYKFVSMKSMFGIAYLMKPSWVTTPENQETFTNKVLRDCTAKA